MKIFCRPTKNRLVCCSLKNNLNGSCVTSNHVPRSWWYPHEMSVPLAGPRSISEPWQRTLATSIQPVSHTFLHRQGLFTAVTLTTMVTFCTMWKVSVVYYHASRFWPRADVCCVHKMSQAVYEEWWTEVTKNKADMKKGLKACQCWVSWIFCFGRKWENNCKARKDIRQLLTFVFLIATWSSQHCLSSLFGRLHFETFPIGS